MICFQGENAMNRYAEQQLLEWKNSPMRKPLLIMGARQVGKTWLMQEFGHKHYKEVAFVSFDSNKNILSPRSGRKTLGRGKSAPAPSQVARFAGLPLPTILRPFHGL